MFGINFFMSVADIFFVCALYLLFVYFVSLKSNIYQRSSKGSMRFATTTTNYNTFSCSVVFIVYRKSYLMSIHLFMKLNLLNSSTIFVHVIPLQTIIAVTFFKTLYINDRLNQLSKTRGKINHFIVKLTGIPTITFEFRNVRF